MEERTAEVTSLLSNIPQGVLSIGSEGLAQVNYSAQLPLILGHESIAKQSFRDLLLQHTNLSSDLQDQAWQTILSYIDEDVLSFEINADKLPREFGLQTGEGVVQIRATWNTLTNEQDVITHLMVTLQDISKEWQAQQELHQKDEKFKLIAEHVEAGSKRVSQLFTSTTKLIEENDALLTSGNLSRDTVKILFVNAHTIKEAARSLQFKSLANAWHQVESKYSDILEGSESYTVQQLQQDLEFVKSVTQDYLESSGSI